MKPIAKRPSLDRTDPKVMKRAAGVAKRRNTMARRKLPLLADLLPVVTAEQVMEQRVEQRAVFDVWLRGKAIKEAADIERYRNEIEEMVSPEEFLRIEAKAEEGRWGGRWKSWMFMKEKILARKEPMPESADLVLALLQGWEGPAPTLPELHQKCGDGMTKEEMRAGLDWLQARELASISLGRPCTVTGINFCATWVAL